jgi:hypothetical protein
VSAALQGLLGDAAVGGKPLPAAAVAAAALAAGQQSDHLLLVAAFEMWRLTGAAAGERAAAQVRLNTCSLAAWMDCACCSVDLLVFEATPSCDAGSLLTHCNDLLKCDMSTGMMSSYSTSSALQQKAVRKHRNALVGPR